MLDLECEHITTCDSRLTALTTLRHARKSVAATEHSGITMWDGRTPIAVLLEPSATVRAMTAFSLNGVDGLAIGDDQGHVSLVSPLGAGGEANHLPGQHEGPIRTLANLALPGDCLVASAGDDGLVRTRRVHERESQSLHGRHEARVTAMCPVDAGRSLLITASEDGNVFYWDPVEQLGVINVIDVERPLTAVCTFLMRGAVWVAVGSQTGEIVLWEISAPRDRVFLGEPTASPVVSLAWITDSAFPVLAALGAHGTIDLWSVSNESRVGQMRLGERGVAVIEPTGRASAEVAYDSSWAALTWDLDLYVLDLESRGS